MMSRAMVSNSAQLIDQSQAAVGIKDGQDLMIRGKLIQQQQPIE